jgi:hypothetical protein
MHHYGAKSHPFSERELLSVCVIRIDITETTGKRAGADFIRDGLF